MSIKYLFDKYGEQIFRVNLQTKSGYDILSVDKKIIAETFSVVSPKNNNKLKKDIQRIEKSNATYKYVFYFSHLNNEGNETKFGNVNIVQFSKDDVMNVFKEIK